MSEYVCQSANPLERCYASKNVEYRHDDGLYSRARRLTHVCDNPPFKAWRKLFMGEALKGDDDVKVCEAFVEDFARRHILV